MKLVLASLAVLAACASTRRQCDPDNKSQYCQDLRRGKTQAIRSPAVQPEPSQVPFNQYPRYKPQGQ